MKFKQRAYEDKVKLKRYLFAFLIFLACGVVTACVIGWLANNKANHPEPRGDLASRYQPVPTVEFNGERYQLKDNITTILVMGTDKYSDEIANETSFRNGGQADFILVLVVDDETQTVTAIPIDRDTISDITILGVLGNETGTRETQICLAHGFGDGAEQSCELQCQAVSRFLLGIKIPYYVAMSMDGISELNDAVGGVTVTLKDDFSALDPDMTLGNTITLKGIQAEYFVRNRKDINVGTNESRMARQKEYWSALKNAFLSRDGKERSKGDIETVLDQISPFLITNMKRGKMINEIWKDKDYLQIEDIQIAGHYKIGNDGFTEFYADESNLEEMVMKTFFDKVIN